MARAQSQRAPRVLCFPDICVLTVLRLHAKPQWEVPQMPSCMFSALVPPAIAWRTMHGAPCILASSAGSSSVVLLSNAECFHMSTR
eukprot:352393-Chlamydomonas_euryale.AAC.4